VKDLGEKLYLNLNTKFKARKIFKNATREENFRRTKNKNNIYFGEGAKISRGKYRSHILTQKAIQYLNYELEFCPKSRALSLLGYCYFMSQDFSNAAKMYISFLTK
jgi:hypothetical protein